MSTVREALATSRREFPEAFPLAPDDWKPRAEAALDGVLLFYGEQPVRVGRRGIDWSGGHVDHQEWPAQLNRFFQLMPLARAYRDSKDEKYAAAARDYIEDWLDTHEPYRPDGPCAPGDSTLNMSVRLGSTRHPGWLASAEGFDGSAAFDEEFLERVVASIAWQIDWLAANCNQEYNWRIAGLDCIFTQSLLVPQRLGRHRRFAAEGLNVEFASQILDDGAHVERSASYNNWMCHVFLTLWRLGRRRPEVGIRFDAGRIVRMHAYRLHLTRPNGESCRFNDAAGGLRTNASAERRVAELHRAHRQTISEAGQGEDVGTFGHFPAAGQVFYRTGWEPGGTWWAFDAAGWGGGHTHLSRLSIELHNGRRTTLPDPGIFDYEMSNPFGPAGKGTPVHSTMNLALLNQSQADARLIRAAEIPGAVVAWGRYAGSYWPGQMKWSFTGGHGDGVFGIQDRMVVWLKDRAMVVLDAMQHEAQVPVYLHWISADVPFELDADRLRFTTADREGNVRIQVCPISPGDVAASVHRGQKDPYLGWVAEERNPAPAPMFQCRFDASDSSGRAFTTQCASVIVPFTGDEAPEFAVTGASPSRHTREVRIDWSDGESERILYTLRPGKAVGHVGDVYTDAKLVVIRRSEGGVETVGALDATFLRIDGRDMTL